MLGWVVLGWDLRGTGSASTCMSLQMTSIWFFNIDIYVNTNDTYVFRWTGGVRRHVCL